MAATVKIELSEQDAGPERLAALTEFLRQELLELDVEDVTAIKAGPPPPGTRTIEMAAVAGLLVSFGKAAEGIGSIVAAIRAWLARAPQAHRTVRLEIDGDVIELSDATVADQDTLVQLFIDRHAAGADD